MKKRSTTFLFAGLLSVLLVSCANQPASTEVTQVSGSTPLMQAAASGDVATVRQLIGQGNSVNAVSAQGTALTRAAASKHREVVMALVRAGADPNLGVSDGSSSPLHHMAEAGDVPAMKMLIAAGANLDHLDGAGLTPIALAARSGSLPATKTLISAGANVNAVMHDKSLLMQVVEQNSLLMAQVLIKAGADVNYEAASGETALTIARAKRLSDLEMLLIQAGARS